MNKRVAAAVVAGMIALAPLPALAEDSAPTPVYGDGAAFTIDAETGVRTEDTEHNKVIEVKPGDEVNITSKLDGSVTSSQIEDAKAQWDKPAYARFLTDKTFGDKIKLSEVDMTYDATFIYPEHMSKATSVKLNDGDDSVFYVESWDASVDNTVTVKMKLKTDNIKTFADLYDLIVNKKVTNDVKLDLYGSKINEDAPAGATLTGTAKLKGTFHAKATVHVGFLPITKDYDYAWEAIQDRNINQPNVAPDGTKTLEGEDGTDALFPGSDEMKLSFRTADAPQPTPEPDPQPEPEPDPQPEPEPEPDPKPEPKPQPKPSIPATGDPASFAAPVAVMGAVLVSAGVARRK